MITKHDLQEAIAECQGVRNPNAATCIKLAAFYTIREHLYPDEQPKTMEAVPTYSFDGPAENKSFEVSYDSGTEFSDLIRGREPEELWPIIDELVTAVQVFNPRLYSSFLDKLQ